MFRQLHGVRVPDNVIRGKLKSHLLPRLSPAPSPGPGRSHGWIFAIRRQHQAERRTHQNPASTWFRFISIDNYSPLPEIPRWDIWHVALVWPPVLCCCAEDSTWRAKIVVACRHQAQAHRLARARRNNSRLAIGNYEMNAAIVGRSSRSKNQTVQW